ncbi:MAG: hypothetical protein V4525_11755 [Pseudomonadota bacterium]
MSILLPKHQSPWLKRLAGAFYTITLFSTATYASHKHLAASQTPLPPIESVTGESRTIHNVKVTWYGSGGRCSARRPCYVAYARVNGYPAVFHNIATEGSGTAEDPITFAANKKVFPIGTLIYIPTFKKYFVFEDKCPQCGNGKAKALHLDLFQGPKVKGHAKSLRKCAMKMNASKISIIIHPDKNLPVETTPILTAKGTCTGQKF